MNGAFVLAVSNDRRHKVVRTMTPEGAAVDAELAPVEARVFAASCDDRIMVVAIGHEGTREVALYACAFLGSCAAMPLPHLGASGPPVRYPLDVARIDGATHRSPMLIAPSPRHATTDGPGRLHRSVDPDAHPDLVSTPLPDHLRRQKRVCSIDWPRIRRRRTRCSFRRTWGRRFGRRRGVRLRPQPSASASAPASALRVAPSVISRRSSPSPALPTSIPCRLRRSRGRARRRAGSGRAPGASCVGRGRPHGSVRRYDAKATMRMAAPRAT